MKPSTSSSPLPPTLSSAPFVRGRLERAPIALVVLYAAVASFSTYFCMYAFRKPFSAAKFEGLTFLGTGVNLKTALVISQIIGYALSKYIGIKIVSEMTRARRAAALVGFVAAAQAALLLFAILPNNWKAAAIFLNGLPLGMIWGLVVWYLEGRRTSELLLAALSCSFILASGVVKDVGRWLMSSQAVSEEWMPFTTGAVFLPLYLLSVWLLNMIPEPRAEDIALRARREPMTGSSRRAFLGGMFPGLVMLMAAYFVLTAYRDYRDNYGVEILTQLGLGQAGHVFTRTELPVAFGVLGVLALLFLIRDNRRALAAAMALMAAGAALLAGSTLLFDAGLISPMWWMVLVGFGSYLAYVPYGSILFDRLMATTRATGTAVFAIYLADAIGYTGSVAVQLYKDLFAGASSRLEFFHAFTLVTSGIAALLLVASLVYFLRLGTSRAPRAVALAPSGTMESTQ